MKNEIEEKIEYGQSEEEVARFWLAYDSTDFTDWDNPVEVMTRAIEEHVVPLPISDAEFTQLTAIASEEQKSMVETIGLLLQRSLKEFRANPSLHL